jgi:hypothetical protein
VNDRRSKVFSLDLTEIIEIEDSSPSAGQHGRSLFQLSTVFDNFLQHLFGVPERLELRQGMDIPALVVEVPKCFFRAFLDNQKKLGVEYHSLTYLFEGFYNL